MSLTASRRGCCLYPSLLSPPSSSVSHAAPLSRDCQVSQHASPCHSSKCLSCCFGYQHLISGYIFCFILTEVVRQDEGWCRLWNQRPTCVFKSTLKKLKLNESISIVNPKPLSLLFSRIVVFSRDYPTLATSIFRFRYVY